MDYRGLRDLLIRKILKPVIKYLWDYYSLRDLLIRKILKLLPMMILFRIV